MIADRLTKTLGPEKRTRLAKMMGMGVWQKSEDSAITKVGEGGKRNEKTRKDQMLQKFESTPGRSPE